MGASNSCRSRFHEVMLYDLRMIGKCFFFSVLRLPMQFQCNIMCNSEIDMAGSGRPPSLSVFQENHIDSTRMCRS